jgi:uncharacterized membrane protein YkoI
MSHRLPLVALLSLLTWQVGVPAADAQTFVERKPRSERQADRPRVSLDQAVNMAESRYRAKAVKAQASAHGDRLVYNIRLLNADGKVWTVTVDAQTGQMF